jgi:tetratricopeptide (TPR) repeat protein
MLAASKDIPDNRAVKLALAMAYSQLGQGLHALRDADISAPIEPYRRSIALREEAVAQNPADAVARRGLMISYANLGGIFYNPTLVSHGDGPAASVYYAKAVAIARELAAADPSNQLAQYDLANALLRYGWIDPAPSEREASLATLNQSVEIFNRLLAADPKSIQIARSLAAAEEYAGQRLQALGRLPEAVSAYRRSLAVTAPFRNDHPVDLPLEAQALADELALSAALAAQRDHTAIDTARKAIASAERIKSISDDARAHSRLAAAYGNLASIYQTLGDCASARGAAQRGIGEWTALGAKSTTEPEHARTVELLRSCEAPVR